MFGTAVIVFREVLEAALIIGILAAATRSVPGRDRWLLGGLVAGLAGSALVAASTDVISAMASGVGQELLNAVILGMAVLMLAWHNIWMTSHGKALAISAKSHGQRHPGRTPRAFRHLLVVVGLAVLREGSETVLFLYGIAAVGGLGRIADVAGRRHRHPGRGSASVTPVRRPAARADALVFRRDQCAGVAAGGRHGLPGGTFPDPGRPIAQSCCPDLGHLDDAPQKPPLPGMLLHSLAGYDQRPAGMQLIFYTLTLATIALGMKWATPHTPNKTVQW